MLPAVHAPRRRRTAVGQAGRHSCPLFSRIGTGGSPIPEATILHNGVISSRPAKEPQEIPVPIIIKCCCGILCRLGYKTILDQHKEA